MNILHTEWSNDLGGQEKRVLYEADGLNKRGFNCIIACREKGKINVEAEKLGIKTYKLPFKSFHDLFTISKLLRIIKKEKIDIVNTHSGIDSWVGSIACKLAKSPVLVRTRHINIALKKNFLNFVHYLPAMYITCGENIRHNLINKCGFSADNVISIPTGISSEFFCNHSEEDIIKTQKALNLTEREIVISNVGILRGVKGHDIFLKAARIVLNSFSNTKFLLVGDGPKRKRLEELAKELDITDNVIFTGYINDIRGIYSISDITVLSSRSEGVPQSVLQAMACSVPVVAARVGGVPEIIENEKTGILVEPEDPQDLASGIMRLINNYPFREDISTRAKAYVIENHSMSIMLDKIEGLYKHLLNNK
ncbi:group 1 glycosyl transferase [Candidatus Magnetoovum chiemensis]|nr:group 1 glycosyl transferase [Candidatus Magnetoovum chiemensis]